MAEYNLLQKKILADGTIKSGDVLKVDSFLNHQIDVPFISKLGKEFYELFKDRPISKILTIEASGIGIACLTAVHFRVPVLFAKKSAGSNMDKDVYSTEIRSFTHNKVNHVVVSKKYLNAGDHVLIIDDFLANGCAVEGLIDLVHQAGAEVEGVALPSKKASRGAAMPCGRRAMMSGAWPSLKKWMPHPAPLYSGKEGPWQKKKSRNRSWTCPIPFTGLTEKSA